MQEGRISMERSREARKSNLASANGLPRRRQRSTSLRDSHEEDGKMELQDTVRLRDRAQKRDRERDRYRDREFSNHHNKIQNKRRRGESLTQENNREEGESTEESIADEEEYDVDDKRVTHINSHCTTPFSSSLSNHNTRKTLPPTRPLKQVPALKAADEMIGVLVPRKARSASVKRSHENWVSGNGGFWEDHRASTSTASRSAEANSPSSSNVSVRKKMKPNGPKTRLPKASKSSSSVQQDDIEIEIAEVLFGLMKQSQNSKNEDDNSLQKLESNDVKSSSQESKPSISVLTQNNSPASDTLHETKKNKVEADNCSNPGDNSSMVSPANKYGCELLGKMENSSAPESQTNAESCEASQVLDAAKESMEPHEEVNKQGDSKPSIEGYGCSDGSVTQRNLVSDERESSLCAKIGDDFQDSTVTKATWTVSESQGRKEEKYKIDLMAPPPMASSPDRDGFNDFASDSNLHDVNIKSVVKDENVKESAVEEVEERIEPIGERRKMNFDLEKPNKDNGRETMIKLQNLSQKQPQPPSKSTIPKVEKSAQSSSVPLQIAVAGWPNSLPHIGYMASFQTIVPMDGSSIKSATAQLPPQFVLSQPRSKRCATHHYIAHNICLNQQLAKVNHLWPAGAGSAPLRGGKPSNINVMPSSENLMHGNALQGSLPVVNLNTMQDKGQTVASFPAITQKDKSSQGVNVMDSAQRKQLVFQQAPQPASSGNFLHTPAFILPVGQQQAAITGAANHSGPSKSATSNKSTLSGNSTAVLPASSTSVPPVASAVSYSYPNMTANEAPYMTILQNNSYPFPVPTSIGAPPTIKGTHSQALPFFNGSFYSSQFFHPSQLQQQQPNSQPLIQAHPNTNTSSASSSSYKQPPQSQQPRGMAVTGSNILSSTSMQPQQPQKQHVPPSNQNRKLEAERSGENTPSLADSRITHNQTSVYSQNFSVPFQPLNFALMPPSAVSGGSSGGNHGEKQQQSQQKSLKGGVELIPPQAFAMSFASFTGSNTASNLSFSSMPQNHAVFQSQGYQVAPAAQAAQQKNHQISEMKNGGGSSNHDDSKKAGLGKSATTNGQTLVFDNPARTLNFVSTPFTGNWPSRSIAQTAITSNAQVASNSQNFHQNQLLQHQKHQTLQQSRSKAQPTTASQPSSSVATKLSNNGSIFPQTLVQNSSTSQSPQWKNSTRIPTSQVSPTSMTSSNTSNLKNVTQQQVRSPQGQTQISFERNSKSGVASQGQQIPTSNQSPSPLVVVGSPPNGINLRPSSTGNKAGSSIPTLQSQQTENSSASTGQKSSPVCGRNVPSILSTCAGQLSELKY